MQSESTDTGIDDYIDGGNAAGDFTEPPEMRYAVVGFRYDEIGNMTPEQMEREIPLIIEVYLIAKDFDWKGQPGSTGEEQEVIFTEITARS